MNPLRGHSITYRIAVDPQAGRKVFNLQTLPASDPEETSADTASKVAGLATNPVRLIRAHVGSPIGSICSTGLT